MSRGVRSSAGIMTVIGLSFLIAESAAQYVLPVVVILARQFMVKEPPPPEEPIESVPEVEELPR